MLRFRKQKNDSELEMGFLDHLEELRWRIIKMLISVVLCGIIIAFFSDWVVNEVILAPAKHVHPPLRLINVSPYGQVLFYLEVIIIGGLILSVPFILYQFWKFIEPGLLPKERQYVSSIVGFTSLCFFTGVLFAYFVILPQALGFFAVFGSSMIENMIDVKEYRSFVLSLILASGLVFELPMISYFLARFGIITTDFMRKYRRHAIVVILILAGVLTPGPDVTSQVCLGIPLIVLYEISILIARFAQKKRAKANAMETI
ncbi:MAG: twin-arginine translocase subunit TatC [Bacteroidota bacterium]